MSYYNRGTKQLEHGNYAKALEYLRRQKEEFKEKYLNMGNAYRGLGLFDEAEKCYIRANDEKIPLASGEYVKMYPLALNNLGLLSYGSGNNEDAIKFYRYALTLDPLYYDCLWNLGNAVLRRYFSSAVPDVKDWELGWKLYEYRFKKKAPTKIENGPRWDGVSSGRRIVVITEQGAGDKIMFGRYVPLLREKFEEVYVCCDASFDCFFDNTVRSWTEVNDCVTIPICSLAGIFGLVDEGYLNERFKAREYSGFNIGCVWSGSGTHANDRYRSCDVDHFRRLSGFGQLHSLNPAVDCPSFMSGGASFDWTETAERILGLSAVVTVDTSVAHLAGTLGVPTVLMQPIYNTDFRWGLGVPDTPWYKSMVIVNGNDWNNIFDNVVELLNVKNN